MFLFGISKKRQEQLDKALIHAVIYSDIDGVRNALKKGANVEARDDTSWTPLHLAAVRKRQDIIEVLLEHGADIHAPAYDGLIPLHVAARSNIPANISLFVEKGANINMQGHEGETPLHLAIRYCCEESAHLLLELGAKPHLQDKDGMTPYQNREKIVRNEDARAIQSALSRLQTVKTKRLYMLQQRRRRNARNMGPAPAFS